MNVVNLNHHSQRKLASVPILLLLDLQKEYLAQGRAFAMNDLDESLKQCARLLSAAREKQLPIAHFKRVSRSPFFNPQCEFGGWIEEFRPLPSEMIFEHDQLSCYDNLSFSNLLKSLDSPKLIVAGIGGQFCGITTAMSAAKRGDDLTWVKDASASSPIGTRSEAESHDIACDIIEKLAVVATVDAVIAMFQDTQITDFWATK
jgi:ureidoacrylate peracid hydrolase